MDRLSPTPEADLVPPGSTGGSAVRTTLYTLLALTLAAGAWVRFDTQIASVSPWLAAPAQTASQVAGAAAETPVRGLLELPLVPMAGDAAAVAAAGLPTDQQTQLAAALKRDRVRLVQLPLFDAGPVNPDGTDAGRSVVVSTAGFTRVVHLGRTPVVLTLPIDVAGTIAFRTATGVAQSVEIGAITVNGPMRLPPIAHGDQLDMEVVAE